MSDLLVPHLWKAKQAQAIVGDLQKQTREEAIKSRVDYKNWSQYLVSDSADYKKWVIDSGRCRGFSVKFLHAEKVGKNFLEIATAENLRISSGGSSAALVDEIGVASAAGNMGAQGEAELNKMMSGNYGLHASATFDCEDASDRLRLHELVVFLCIPDTFCLISVFKHTMACAAKGGGVKLFDPNIGQVSCCSKEDLVKFLDHFFNLPDIRKIYGGGEKVSLKVRRYSAPIQFLRDDEIGCQ